MKELILRYFDAFANLYGIITMKRAYRIIEKQNLELNLTKEQFAKIVNEFDFPDKYYVKGNIRKRLETISKKTDYLTWTI